MKKVLILTYFFPPSNFAGSYRMASFAKYLHHFGYYPVIITRQSFEGACSFGEMAKDCGDKVIFEQHDGYEVHYLPYKGNLRDKIYSKYGADKFTLVRKILSFFELILQVATVRVVPFSNMYFYAKKHLKNNKDIDFILCSGKPFQLFLFGYLLSKKFGIKWIAEYRDEWNSRYKFNNFKIRLKEKFFCFFETHLEKKWTKNAALITTVTKHWAENLSGYLNKPCKVVLNGYDPELINNIISEPKTKEPKANFVFMHLGSLYEWQPIEIFMEAVIDLLKDNYKIACYFPGITNEPANESRIRKLSDAFPESFFIMPRINQQEVYKIMHKADAFLMVGYQNFKGWMSTKVLEYLPWHKPIILCPGDNGILETLLKPYSKTVICNTAEALKETIKRLYINREASQLFDANDENYAKNFARKKQVEVFANLLNDLKN